MFYGGFCVHTLVHLGLCMCAHFWQSGWKYIHCYRSQFNQSCYAHISTCLRNKPACLGWQEKPELQELSQIFAQIAFGLNCSFNLFKSILTWFLIAIKRDGKKVAQPLMWQDRKKHKCTDQKIMTYDSISALTAVKATLPHLSFSAKRRATNFSVQHSASFETPSTRWLKI